MTTTGYTTSNDALVAVFPDRESAKDAAHELHGAGYHNMWIGVTKTADDATGGSSSTIVDDDDLGSKIGRFFSGDARDLRLGDALRRHGVSEAHAARLEGTIPAGTAVLTVPLNDGDTTVTTTGTNDPRTIVEQCGGRLLDADYGSRGLYHPTETLDRLESGTTATEIATGSSDGMTADEQRRIRLREERLKIDKERVERGEARIGTRVVTEQQNIEVPIYHEELFVERRPVSGDVSASPIGEGQEIRVPLSEERVVTGKETVVTEEIAVGKRRVGETEHVTDTLRKEVLDVSDGSTSQTGTNRDGTVYNDPTTEWRL